jgi:hypothetical protein
LSVALQPGCRQCEEIAATFQTPGTSFVVNGAAQAADSALTTAAVEMRWKSPWSAGATFEGEFSAVTASYSGKGVVRSGAACRNASGTRWLGSIMGLLKREGKTTQLNTRVHSIWQKSRCKTMPVHGLRLNLSSIARWLWCRASKS